MRLNDINIRDPFVLVHDQTYYMYGTRGETAFTGEAFGFDVYVSKDLKTWDGPIEVFRRPEGFFSKKSYWAPEVYFVDGRFFMFATFENQKKGLGTMALVADDPCGPFKPWSDGYLTPEAMRCLDGTLYVDKNGGKHIVFCHEWKQVHDGEICVMRLCDDLSSSKGFSKKLFTASMAKPYVKKFLFINYVTDGPFMIRTDDGRLHMLWSTYGKTGYVQAMAHSDNDEIDGNWKPDSELLFASDGGHGMIFKDLTGNYNLVLHSPNTFRKEHPVFVMLKYENGRFVCTDK